MIKNESIQQLQKKYNENKFSHIFLIETDNKTEALNDLLELVKYINCSGKYKEDCEECNLCHLINNNSLPSLSIIYPDGQAIKKAQMEELKILFSHKPYLSKYNIYIIYDAEKFNSSSANTMLKFIEEPEEKTIGFLITNNKENVINTIKSRCELVKVKYNAEIENNASDLIINLAIEYIENIEILQKSIVVNKLIVDKKLEKNELLTMFQVILHIYVILLRGEVQYEQLDKLKTFSTKKIICRIKLINDIIDKLNYNVNINLLLDYFVLNLED